MSLFFFMIFLLLMVNLNMNHFFLNFFLFCCNFLIKFVTSHLFPHLLKYRVIFQILLILRPIQLIFLLGLINNILPIFGFHFFHDGIDLLIWLFYCVDCLNNKCVTCLLSSLISTSLKESKMSFNWIYAFSMAVLISFFVLK